MNFKKKILFIVFYSLSFVFFAQEVAHEQFVSPTNIYLADDVQIKYYFQTGANLIGDGENRLLKNNFIGFNKFNDLCFVKNVSLLRSGSEYALSMIIVPWQVGTIDIPPFDLSALIEFSQTDENFMIGTFLVDVDPIRVNSIVEYTKKNTIQMPQGPMTVPGTTAFLICASIVAFILLVAIFVLLFKIPAIKSYLNDSKSARMAKKNIKTTIKKLKRLLKSFLKNPDDKLFACELQKILRTYSQKRFDKNFDSVTTDELASIFLEFAGGQFSDNQDKGVCLIYEIFKRCDYVRYANTTNIKLFLKNEREQLIQKSFEMIEAFEAEEKLEESENDI